MNASSVKWVKIGSYIEQYLVRNSDGLYGESDAIGVNIEKEILPMRGNISEKDFSKFYLVPPKHFAYNADGTPIILDTPEQLYEFLEENYKNE